MDYEYEGNIFKIKKETFYKQRFYCVMQNPFNPDYDTKVLYGGSVEIVQRKIQIQYKKWRIQL